MARLRRAAPLCESRRPIPFSSAEEAWFWSIAAWLARREVARARGGAGEVSRPCEPHEVTTLAERLLRAGRLGASEFKVLMFHGRSFLPPDPSDPRQGRRLQLWDSGLATLSEALRHRGIVE